MEIGAIDLCGNWNFIKNNKLNILTLSNSANLSCKVETWILSWTSSFRNNLFQMSTGIVFALESCLEQEYSLSNLLGLQVLEVGGDYSVNFLDFSSSVVNKVWIRSLSSGKWFHGSEHEWSDEVAYIPLWVWQEAHFIHMISNEVHEWVIH